ncbi:hypothetical protein CALCODRAFT_553392 [Calocera cornea HHB12733]|uniref:Uncharacterized protein n=1 Tax=Calocera cornea HHB12733 TaxID=1353952 RepID=A0A165IRA2_9BASI|nr:hypothetical protein CALCODRAFT_553392 [Calocera cornea HHB12733]
MLQTALFINSLYLFVGPEDVDPRHDVDMSQVRFTWALYLHQTERSGHLSHWSRANDMLFGGYHKNFFLTGEFGGLLRIAQLEGSRLSDYVNFERNVLQSDILRNRLLFEDQEAWAQWTLTALRGEGFIGDSYEELLASAKQFGRELVAYKRQGVHDKPLPTKDYHRVYQAE